MADQILKLRCSALPLAFKCAGSVRPSAIEINETNDAAALGTAAHEALAFLVGLGRPDWDAVPALAKRHGVNEVELRVLLAAGAKLWDLVKDSLPNAMTEVALEHTDESLTREGLGYTLTGHADILGRSGNTAHLGDWKTGRTDSEYREQLLGYCALALLEDHTLESATAGVLWVREGEYEHYSMTRDELEPWLMRLVSEVLEWDGTWRPGSHCAHCHRNHECPAAMAMVRRDVSTIADASMVARVEDESALALMHPDEVVDLLGKADLVVKYAERVRSAIRQHVIKNGDVVGCGKRITLQQEERRKLITLAAFPVLEEAGLGDEEMAHVIDISAAKAEKIVADKAGKGKGAGAVRALKAALEQAGAVRTETVTKLVTRRA
jgi:hypothetical protein